jgi:DNA-binding Lrp family transcriptional regulator
MKAGYDVVSSKNLRDFRPLDETDVTLVTLLQENGRMSNSELAERAGIAASTCVSRVRSLLDRGIITGFTAIVDPPAVGIDLQVLISVSVRAGARQRIAELSEQLQNQPEVMQLFFLGGAEDFIIHLAAHSAEQVRDFVMDHLSAHPAVASTRTSMVFDHFSTGPKPQ